MTIWYTKFEWYGRNIANNKGEINIVKFWILIESKHGIIIIIIMYVNSPIINKTFAVSTLVLHVYNVLIFIFDITTEIQ